MFKNLLDKVTQKFKSKNKDSSTKIDSVFVYESEEVEINPKYIKPSDYQQLVAFEKFIKNHEEITNENIREFLCGENKMFISELYQNIPNFIDELRKNGAKSVALIYVSDKLYSHKINA